MWGPLDRSCLKEHEGKLRVEPTRVGGLLYLGAFVPHVQYNVIKG